jgi:hypothetical protein
MTRKLTIIALLVGITVLILGVVKWIAWTPTREMETTARSMIGRPEAELVQALGQPRHVVSSATLAGRTVDYPWKDMSFVPVPDHPVRNKVLLYSKLNVAIYVYVDEKGVIEYVAVAGT